MANRLSYSEALAKDRDKYLRQRNLLGKTLRDALALLESGATNDNFHRAAQKTLETIFED